VERGQPIIIGFLAITGFTGKAKKIAIRSAARIVKFLFFISNPPLYVSNELKVLMIAPILV
jgi:hypothetical protein